MQTAFFRALFLFVTLPALADCQTMPTEYKEFFALPAEQQRAKLKSFPVDKQIEYHLAGHQYFHPPIGFTEEIASRGREAVPHLVKRLREEKLEHRQMILMYLFKYMHFFHYDLSGEKEVLQLLKDITGKMEPSYSKENAENILTDILENRRPSLEQFKEERPKVFKKQPE